jgi:hypothetical protein
MKIKCERLGFCFAQKALCGEGKESCMDEYLNYFPKNFLLRNGIILYVRLSYD